MSIIEIRKLGKYFDSTEALKNVTFDIREGEFLGIVGPSGCGKSALLRIIAGLEKASCGERPQTVFVRQRGPSACAAIGLLSDW